MIPNIGSIVFVIFIGWIFMRLIFDIYSRKKPLTTGKIIKFIISSELIAFISLSSLFLVALHIYDMAVIWKDIETTNVIPFYIEELSYQVVSVFYLSIAIVSIWIVFKFVYLQQIIPGEGTANQRLKNLMSTFKRSGVDR